MQDLAPNLLESWKEIAAFLGRDKRTAMRWAVNHGMPVHRYPGSKQGRVFAHRNELTTWLESFSHLEIESNSGNSSETNGNNLGNHSEVREDITAQVGVAQELTEGRGADRFPRPLTIATVTQTVPVTSPSKAEAHAAQENALLASVWKRSRVILAVTGLLVLAIGVTAVLQPMVRSAAGLKAAGLVQLTEDGRYKTDLRTDGTTLFFDELAGVNRMLASTPIQGGPVRPIPAPFVNVSLLDVSRDGKTLLVADRDGVETDGLLWKLPAQGGSPTRVGEVRCSDARWSPDGKQIVFEARSSLYLTDAGGHEPHVILPLAGAAMNFIWSPDGRILRFVVLDVKTGIMSGWELVSNERGSFADSVARELRLSSPCCTNWTWTGNGKDFAYVVAKKGEGPQPNQNDQRLFRSGWFGTQQELTINLGRVLSLASGKNGSRLYFLISSADRGELLRFSKKEKVFQNYLPGLSARYLSFSRDGLSLSYSLTKDRSLWRSNADGTQALQIVGPPMDVDLSSWSPDGRQIAFMGQLPGKPWRIYLVGRDGGSPREATAGDDNQGAPTWSPDGKTIAYGRVDCAGDNACGIFQLDVETGRARPIPESQKLRTVRWSPDGKYLAAFENDGNAVQIFDLKKRRWYKLAENVEGDDLNWSNDSSALYVSCLVCAKPSIDKVRISDHSRSTAVDLAPFQKMPGQLVMWFGLSPDDSPIVLHLYTSSEVYALDLNEP